MLDVYLDPPTINSRKLLAGLELLGAPYKITHVSYVAGAHKRPPYTDLNPNGVLPAAKDGNFILWESNAILQYVADANGGEQYYPRDLRTRADINRWLFWEAAHWQPSCYAKTRSNQWLRRRLTPGLWKRKRQDGAILLAFSMVA